MSQGVDRLKEILFDTEARRLDELNRRLHLLAEAEVQRHGELARRVEAVFERAGTEERLRKSVAGILDGALRDAEVDKHTQLSEAVAPLVVSTIKFELRNSQDEMVDALYPITGRLVKQYVAAAVKDMMVQINSRLAVGFPGRRLAMRARSIMTGTSMSEMALAETQRLAIEELFLIRRGSGDLVAHWAQSANPKTAPAAIGANRDALIPPYLVAINAFAEDAFSANADGMRTLDMGDHRMYLRSSVAYLLAAKCSGSGPAAVEQVIDEQFLSALTQHKNALAIPARPAGMPPLPGGPAANAGGAGEQAAALARILPSLARSLDQRLADKHAELAPSGSGSFAPLYTITAMILLPIAGWLAWTSWQSWQASRTRDAVQAVLGSVPEIGSYPIQIDVDRGGRAYALTGLAPSSAVRDQIMERLRREIPHAEVRDRLAAVSGVTAGDPEAVAALRRSLASVEADLWRAPILRTIDRMTPRMAALAGDLRRIGPALTTDNERAELARVIAAITASEPLALQAQRDASTPAATRTSVATPLAQLQSQLTAIETSLSIMTGGVAPAARAQASTNPVYAAEEISALVERLAMLGGTLERALPQRSLPQQITALRQRLDGLKLPDVPGQSARERLAAFARAHAVFFANNSDYLDDQAATRTLDELAQLVQATDARIRVIGYTDELGSQSRNSNIAISRAQRVAAELTSRGVQPGRIVAVGRSNGFDLYPRTGPGTPNRRVEFEIGFIGEPGGP